ncbi:Serine protease 16, partial [Coemansia sp. RSA 2559]
MRVLLFATLLLLIAITHSRAEPMAIRHLRLRHRQIENLINDEREVSAVRAVREVGMRSAVLDAEGASATGNQRLGTSSAVYFSQKVDHFGSNSSTFKQLFYINSKEYVPGGPIYLFNSGETPASPSYLAAGEPYTLAKATGGMVIIMEHRYYGVSYPVSDMSGPNMKYLTLENALEDVAYFIRNGRGFISENTGISISAESKWIAVGGS